MALPVNTFVVFGSERAPEVHLINDRVATMLDDRERVTDRQKALVATFGTGAECALPAWSIEAMEFIALNYRGAYEREVRGICAAIALDKPFGPDTGGRGDRIEVKRPKPTPRGPASVQLQVKYEKTEEPNTRPRKGKARSFRPALARQ